MKHLPSTQYSYCYNSVQQQLVLLPSVKNDLSFTALHSYHTSMSKTLLQRLLRSFTNSFFSIFRHLNKQDNTLCLKVLIQTSMNDQLITVTLMQVFLYSIHYRKMVTVLISHITASSFSVTSNITDEWITTPFNCCHQVFHTLHVS